MPPVPSSITHHAADIPGVTFLNHSQWPAEGMYADLPEAVYHGWAFTPSELPNLATAGPVSASLVCHARNPLSVLRGLAHKKTDAMDWGNLIDCLFLTPARFHSRYIEKPQNTPRRPTKAQINAKKQGQTTIDAIAFWKKWDATHGGKEEVEPETMREARHAVELLKIHPDMTEMVDGAVFQVAISARNVKIGGFTIPVAKALIDIVPTSDRFKDGIADLKTRHSVQIRALSYGIADFEYHIKTKFYLALWNHMVPEGQRTRAYLGWQKSKPPYSPLVSEVDPEDLQMATNAIAARCALISRLNPKKIWEAMTTGVQIIPRPHLAKNEDRAKGYGVQLQP